MDFIEIFTTIIKLMLYKCLFQVNVKHGYKIK